MEELVASLPSPSPERIGGEGVFTRPPICVPAAISLPLFPAGLSMYHSAQSTIGLSQCGTAHLPSLVSSLVSQNTKTKHYKHSQERTKCLGINRKTSNIEEKLYINHNHDHSQKW